MEKGTKHTFYTLVLVPFLIHRLLYGLGCLVVVKPNVFTKDLETKFLVLP